MEDIDELRAEVADLRETTRVLLTITTAMLANSQDAVEAAKRVGTALATAWKVKERSDLFEEFAGSVLHALVQQARRIAPDDEELKAMQISPRPRSH
jgi:hypothetical protein